MPAKKLDAEKGQLSDLLLPFDIDKVTQSKANLKHYHFLLVIFKMALEAIQKRDYLSFDAPGGDNLCQTRALWLALKVDSFRDIPERIKQIDQAINQIATIEKSKNWESKSLKKLLEDNPTLRMDLTSDESFLVQCFVLQKVQVIRDPRPEAPLLTNGLTINTTLNHWTPIQISTNSSAKFVEFFRMELSKKSADFMHQQAVRLGDKSAIKMLSDKYKIYVGEGRRKRTSISCFWSFKVFSDIAFKYELPIVMRCWFKLTEKLKEYKLEQAEHEMLLFLKPAVELKSYLIFEPRESDLSRIAMVVEGVSCRQFPVDKGTWKKELLEHDISEYMLTFAAGHKQYVNEKEDHLIAEASTKAEYLEYKQKNEKIGCSLENPSHFFINHVYCKKIGDMVGTLKA